MTQIRFTWNIHWSCNYRCSYCFFDQHWEEYGKRNVYKSVDEWLFYWQRIYDQYGKCYITINGGEPFTYPNFIQLILQLSQLHWHINITTNTSAYLEEFVEKIDPEKVSLSVSFHPQYHKIEPFIEKTKWLRSKGFGGCNNLVAYPPYLKEMWTYVGKFKTIGESLKIIPFVGEYKGKQYPDSYSREQKEFMGMKDDWVEHKRHKGMLCRAGYQSALLLPNGKVARCGQIGDRFIIGNFFDPNFKLMDKSTPCDVDFCPCDEWKVIPDEKPAEISGAWLP